jgi:hypothetical protein
MDKNEARAIAECELEAYRAMSYEEIITKLGEQESFERVSEKGEPYQIEFEFFYDDAEEKNIRVSAAVSYSGWTYFSPVSDDFIMAPNGSFVGE